MPSILQELRQSARSLRRSPGFTLTAVLTLGLAIGANTAAFERLYRALIQPLPFTDAERLVLVWQSNPRSEWRQLPASYPNYRDLKEQNTVFTDLAAWHNSADLSFTLTGGTAPRPVPYALATPNLFELLGVVPALGRGFLEEENRPNGPQVALVSHRFWSEVMAQDPGAIGRTVVLDGVGYEVVGVLPRGFRFVNHPAEPEVWLPVALDPPGRGRMFARPVKYLGVVARLNPGVSLERAGEEVAAIAGRLASEYPGSNTGWTFGVETLRNHVSGQLRPALVILQVAVMLVLLVAAANLTALLLARGNSRARELALRAALGAGRGRLLRQQLLETALLSLLGGAAGIVLAMWTGGLLDALAIGSSDPLAFYDVMTAAGGLGAVTLFAAAGLALLTGLLAGALPALRLSRLGPQAVLKSGAVDARESTRVRDALVVAELAGSMILLVGAALLLKSFAQLRRVDPGFRSTGVLTAELNLRRGRYDAPAQMVGFTASLLQRLAALPGVIATGGVELLPLSGRDQTTDLRLDGAPAPAPGQEQSVHYRSVAAQYLDAMSIPLVSGRGFGSEDGPGGTRVAVINEAMARSLWPGQNPLGHRVALSVEALVFDRAGPPRLDFDRAYRTVVGVVRDIRHAGIGQSARPEMYVPYGQLPTRDLTVVIRVAGDPMLLAPALRRAVQELDPDQPIVAVASMDQRVDQSLAQPRVRAQLLGFFAALAATLAAIGVYGVIAFVVTRRTREIGIRLALGATPRQVVAEVVKHGGRLLLAGLALGLAGAWFAARGLAGLLFGVSPVDGPTFGMVTLLLSAVTLLAIWLPARRAASTDPMTSLRAE